MSTVKRKGSSKTRRPVALIAAGYATIRSSASSSAAGPSSSTAALYDDSDPSTSLSQSSPSFLMSSSSSLSSSASAHSARAPEIPERLEYTFDAVPPHRRSVGPAQSRALRRYEDALRSLVRRHSVNHSHSATVELPLIASILGLLGFVACPLATAGVARLVVSSTAAAAAAGESPAMLLDRIFVAADEDSVVSMLADLTSSGLPLPEAVPPFLIQHPHVRYPRLDSPLYRSPPHPLPSPPRHRPSPS